jgi:hypothetical protein
MLALAGCGQQSNSQRADVAAYLKHVQRTETAFQSPLSEVAKVGSVLAQEQKGDSLLGALAEASNEASLDQASRRLAVLRTQLATTPAPASAAHLRRLLLELADRQIALARELASLVVFLPQFTTALKPLAPATTHLQAALTAPSISGTAAVVAAAYEFKAAALRTFALAVEKIEVALRSLHPPAVWAPAFGSQVASLRGMHADAVRLAGALTGGQTGQFAPLIVAFDRAATLGQTVPAQRARIHAVQVYDAEVQAQNKLAAAIEVERLRLAQALPQ